MNMPTTYLAYLDKLTIATSAICAIHCLFLPILIVVFPALGATIFGQETFHALLLWFIIPSSIVALTLGCRAHRYPNVAVLGATGLAILIFTAILGHDLIGESGERIATLLGSFAIAAGHLGNYMLCQRI
ncbi:MAG: MerC domain-containing protein [Pseudomonadota bacterium]